MKRLMFHGHNNFHVQVRKNKSTIYFALPAVSELLPQPLALAGALVADAAHSEFRPDTHRLQ